MHRFLCNIVRIFCLQHYIYLIQLFSATNSHGFSFSNIKFIKHNIIMFNTIYIRILAHQDLTVRNANFLSQQECTFLIRTTALNPINAIQSCFVCQSFWCIRNAYIYQIFVIKTIRKPLQMAMKWA